MAKFLSQIMTIARGSVGGVTFTANQFQQLIMRAKTAPVNPSSSVQSSIRSAFAQACSRWAILTDEQRQAWSDYAETLQFTGPLGPYTMPGRQVMVGNLTLVLYGNNYLETPLVPIWTAPTTPGFTAFSDVKPVPVTTGVGVALTITNTTGKDMHALVERSIAFPASRNLFKGPFLSSSAQFVPCPDPTSVLLEFKNLEVGAVYFMRVRGVQTETAHRITPELIFRAVATEES